MIHVIEEVTDGEDIQYWVSLNPDGEGYLPINRKPEIADADDIRTLFAGKANPDTGITTSIIRWHRRLIVKQAAFDEREVREYTVQ